MYFTRSIGSSKALTANLGFLLHVLGGTTPRCSSPCFKVQIRTCKQSFMLADLIKKGYAAKEPGVPLAVLFCQ